MISSSGGHYEQLMMLGFLKEEFETFIVTERTEYNKKEKNIYLVKQINRKEKKFFFNLFILLIQSAKIFYKEKPDVIISTGAMAVIPMFILGQIFNKKLIYIESFAKSDSPTLTGKFIYKFADLFIVQWESMRKYYPEAIMLGSIY